MKHKKTFLVMCIALVLGLTAHGQSSTNTSGGEATGSGGTVSYTVGQVVYRTNTGANGSVAEGVQQPYEISVVTGIVEAKGISLSVSAYPNPTTDYLIVKVDASTSHSIQSLTYQIFDINGKLLQTVKATGSETQIETSKLVPANYFVKVLDNNKAIKVFKIIKN